MKRAKLLLVGVGLCALVGGAYAFKAKQNQSIWVRTSETTGICEQQVRFRTLQPNGPVLGNTFATDVAGDACPTPVDYFQGS